jgi:hypothetical protein
VVDLLHKLEAEYRRYREALSLLRERLLELHQGLSHII